MTKSAFESELVSLDPRTTDSREEILNTAGRLAVDVGLKGGRAQNIILGKRETGFDFLDRIASSVNKAMVVRSKFALELIDSSAASIANRDFYVPKLEYKLFEAIDRALYRIGEPLLTDAEKAELRKKVHASFVAEVLGPDRVDPDRCFIAGSLIDMWPTDPLVRQDADGLYDEDLVCAKAWKKPVEEIMPGDVVMSYDNDGNLKPGRVTRAFENTATHILDFWGVGVTPGHAYLCGDGKFKGDHVPVIDILRSDGAVVRDDGKLIRAATGCDVGSMGDRMVHAIVGEGQRDGGIKVREIGQIRLGTRVILEDGRDLSVMDLIFANNGVITEDGYIQTTIGGEKIPFRWVFSEYLPKPEDYILRRSDVGLQSIYLAGEWENIGTRLAAPRGAADFIELGGVTGATLKPYKPLPNVPPAFADHPDAPGINRKQRKAKEAKRHKAAKEPTPRTVH